MLLSVVLGEPWAFDLEAVSLRSALGLLYLIVFGSIVAFSAYLETQTPTPPARKAQAAARAMKSPADARQVAEQRARSYLAYLTGRARAQRR